MEFHVVVHFMEAACKKCWSAAGFCKLLATLSRWTNRGLTPARTCQDRRKLFVPALACREMLGVPYTSLPWCCHSDMVFWLGFAPLSFGSDKNLYHKAVVYNSAWQGRQTPWGIAIPEVLQHLHTIMRGDTIGKYNITFNYTEPFKHSQHHPVLISWGIRLQTSFGRALHSEWTVDACPRIVWTRGHSHMTSNCNLTGQAKVQDQ